MNLTITDSRRLNTRSSTQQRLDPGADLLRLARRQQVTNGMAVRMAVMAIILGGSAAPEGKRA